MSETRVATLESSTTAPPSHGSRQSRKFRPWAAVTSPIIQTALAVIIVVTLSLAASVALIVAHFDRTLQDIVQSRFDYIATELKGDIEKGLDLGLALREFSNAQQVLDQQLARNDDLRRIVIRDMEDNALFSAEKAGADGSADRHREVTATLVNPFGRDAGTVTVAYTAGGALDAVYELARHLAVAAAVIAGIAALSAAAACLVIMHRIPRSLQRAQAALCLRDPPTIANDPIEQTTVQAAAMSRTTLEELGALAGESPSSSGGGAR